MCARNVAQLIRCVLSRKSEGLTSLFYFVVFYDAQEEQ